MSVKVSGVPCASALLFSKPFFTKLHRNTSSKMTAPTTAVNAIADMEPKPSTSTSAIFKRVNDNNIEKFIEYVNLNLTGHASSGNTGKYVSK